MPDFPHQHLQIPANRHQLRFKADGRGKFNRRVNLTREQHAARLQRQIDEVETQFRDELNRRSQFGENEEFCLILNIESAPNFPLKLDSLEKAPSKSKDGIYLLNIRYRMTEQGVVTCAAVQMPFGRLDILANKIAAYSDPTKDRKNKDGATSPANADLLANLDSICVAALEALWTEPEPLPVNDEETWWELWVSLAPRAETHNRTWVQLFESAADSVGLEVNRYRLRLPDNEIVLVKAKKSELEGSLELLNTLTEVRKVHPCCLDLTGLPGPEQHEWIAEALARITWPSDNAPAVCLLDTGVNRGHPLLERLLAEEDLDTIIPVLGNADHPNPRNAHGTPMAGMAAYDDLRNLMLSIGAWNQEHRLESIKLIHDGDEHNPQNYGAVTQEAISRPEIAKPQRSRVFCLPITQASFPAFGQPSSWSSAVDASAAGTGEENDQRRVIFISAGNHRDFLNYTYPASNMASRVENPAQAWNCITVGAMTRKSVITEEDDESRRARAVASPDEISPFSRSSAKWDPRWPIKPDIVMEGGNAAQTESGQIIERGSLELISTASNFLANPLCNMNATSAATASASRLGAILMARFPDYWPETYRGLLVHSARWRPRMLGHIDPHRPGNTGAVQSVIRTYGFGEPEQARLFGSGESGVTMIIQDHIQPYDPNSDSGKAKLGYFNLHTLPWPKQVFEQHPDVELTLRVSLSYFIHPNPGSRCWDRSQKYRYASHLLRFDFKRPTESEDSFQKALEKKIELDEDDEFDNAERRVQSDPKWALGSKLRGKFGSLVHDVWKGSPADLAEMGQVAVFPAKGWFATRSFKPEHEFHNCHQRQVRYSLIISIDAEQEIGLYTAISNQLIVPIPA